MRGCDRATTFATALLQLSGSTKTHACKGLEGCATVVTLISYKTLILI
jgi:hypothetical protein